MSQTVARDSVDARAAEPIAEEKPRRATRTLTGRRLSFAEVLGEELDVIDGRVRDREVGRTEEELYREIHARGDRLPALCLSGGGIRSATFCLGVLQGFAKRDVLGRFKYLSTVSGGGYIGSWLTAWIHRKATEQSGGDATARVVRELAGEALDPVELERHVCGVAAEAPAIHQLRRFSNYLAPEIGLLSADVWTVIATMVRNIILNWLVMIPMLVAALGMPRLLAAAASETPSDLLIPLLAIGFAGCVWTTAYVSRQRLIRVERRSKQSRIIVMGVLPVWIAAVALALAWALWHPSAHELGESAASTDLPRVVLFGVAVMVAGWLFYLASVQVSGSDVDDALRRGARGYAAELLAFVLTGAIGGAILFLAGMAFETTDLRYDCCEADALVYATFAPPVFILSFALAATIFVGLASALMSEENREWWSRFGAWALMSSVAWVAVSMTVLLAPQWIAGARTLIAASVGALGSGALTIVGGLSTKTIFKAEPEKQRGVKDVDRPDDAPWLGRLVSIALPIFLVLFGVFLSLCTDFLVAAATGRSLAWADLKNGYLRQQWHVQLANDPANLWVILAAAALGVAASFRIGINEFSLHAMYRNRLIRAYLGASRGTRRRADPFIGFDPDDDVALCRTRPEPGQPRPLFHVLNMSLNLVGGGDLAWQERKAESMTATSLHAGTRTLGYRLVDEYGGLGDAYGHGHPLTLGTAMAISGAAASPNMGYHSSPVLTFLMTLFNARLGWWLGNPGPAGNRTYFRDSPRWALRPLLAEAFGETDKTHPYVYVSDGGHFENLGLYEMVRRRCGLIVVVDAASDARCEYDDLSGAIRKIRSDMGIPIDLPPHDKRPIRARTAGHGESGRMAFVGRIRYGAVDRGANDGALIYIKPAFYDRDEPLDVVNYAHAHPTFPHESTADQFFFESQFESYRTLGLFAVDGMCREFDRGETRSLDDLVKSVEAYVG